MAFSKTQLNHSSRNQTAARGKALHNLVFTIPTALKHTHTRTSQRSSIFVFFFFFKSAIKMPCFESTCSANLFFKQEEEKVLRCPYKTVNRKPEASFTAIFLADARSDSINQSYSHGAGFYVS